MLFCKKNVRKSYPQLFAYAISSTINVSGTILQTNICKITNGLVGRLCQEKNIFKKIYGSTTTKNRKESRAKAPHDPPPHDGKADDETPHDQATEEVSSFPTSPKTPHWCGVLVSIEQNNS
jgi:hypothetical protein